MKTFKPRSGPFSERPYYSTDDIENICIEELSKVGLLPLEPAAVRIDRFIEKRFGPHVYERLPDGVLGLTRFGAKGVQEIVIASHFEGHCDQPKERLLRTTLGHEAGHGLLHAHLFALGNAKPLFGDWSDAARPKVLCRDYSGEWWEYQANMVMGAILMPRRLVQLATEPYLTPVGMLGAKAFDESRRESAARALAQVFDVNPAAVRVRLSQLYPPKTSGQLTL